MKTLKTRRLPTAGLIGLALLLGAAPACAQWGGQNEPEPPARPEEVTTGPVSFEKTGMSGPRFGLTYLPGDTEMTRRLREEGMEPLLSQFGWHFERRVTPAGGGPQFVIETVPMVAGVEYGKLLPNLTLAMGVRFPSGWEFGIGPNLIVTGLSDSSNLETSLVTAAGYSFRYAGVSLPVNVAFATNPDGNRISLIFGYAIRR